MSSSGRVAFIISTSTVHSALNLPKSTDMVKGFTLDDERLKKLGGGDYWKELVGQAESFKRHGQLRPYVIDNDSYSSMVAEP